MSAECEDSDIEDKQQEQSSASASNNSASSACSASISGLKANAKYYYAFQNIPAAGAAQPKRVASPPPPMPLEKKPVPITDYAWSDSDDVKSLKVSIYVPFPSIENHPKDKITANFTPTSVDLLVSDVQGPPPSSSTPFSGSVSSNVLQSYRFHLDDLNDEIDAQKSKFSVKHDKIVLILKKVKEARWYDLVKKKSNSF